MPGKKSSRRLDADRAQMKLLGPAPAAGQPQEPEQAALGRAELNYHFGLLSAGQAAVKSTNLRIDNLLNTIQEIYRKNFASDLFQPIPGVYAYETWAKLPEYVPQTVGKIRDLIADWWRDVQVRADVTRIALEALLMSLASFARKLAGVPQVAAMARCQRAAVLAACVFSSRSGLASRASRRGSCCFFVHHDSRRAAVAGTRGLAVLFDDPIDRDRVHSGCAGHCGICSRRAAMAAHCRFGPCAPRAYAVSSFCLHSSTV